MNSEQTKIYEFNAYGTIEEICKYAWLTLQIVFFFHFYLMHILFQFLLTVSGHAGLFLFNKMHVQ